MKFSRVDFNLPSEYLARGLPKKHRWLVKRVQEDAAFRVAVVSAFSVFEQLTFPDGSQLARRSRFASRIGIAAKNLCTWQYLVDGWPQSEWFALFSLQLIADAVAALKVAK